MIKQVQLRGISRLPSDRMSADGGCAESLNVQIEEQELKPMLRPRNVTMTLTGMVPNTTDKVVFIHKVGDMENYLFLRSSGGVESIRFNDRQIVSLGSEVVSKIVSQGNIVLVSTQKSVHYILYGDSWYKYLGTKIPEPIVKMDCTIDAPLTDTVEKVIEHSQGGALQ